MREYVTKVVKCKNATHTWTSGGAPLLIFHVDHATHMIHMELLKGCDPTIDDIVNILTTDRDCVHEIRWAATHYKRKGTVTIDEYVGVSGCRSIKLSTTRLPAWALGWNFSLHENILLNISMYGKVGNGLKDWFSGDMLDIITYLNKDYDNFYRNLKELVEQKRKWMENKKEYRYIRFNENRNRHAFCSLCGHFDKGE